MRKDKMISIDFIETCSGRLRWLLAVLGAGDGALLDDGALEVVVDVAELARGRLLHLLGVPRPVEAAGDGLARLLAGRRVVLQVVAAARQDVGAGVGKVGHAAVHILAWDSERLIHDMSRVQ